MSELPFAHWQEDDGLYLGYLVQYPEYLTQGRTLDELRDMLADLASDLEGGPHAVPNGSSPGRECSQARRR